MSTPGRLLLLFVSVLVVLPLSAEAQVTLLTPPDGAETSSPASFGWNGPDYDWFYYISIFYYDLGVWDGYWTTRFWLPDTGFGMPSTWWDQLGLDLPCYWLVVGVNSATGAYAFSDLGSFTRVEEQDCNANGVQTCIGQVFDDYSGCRDQCAPFDCAGMLCRSPCLQERWERSMLCIIDAHCGTDPLYSQSYARYACLADCAVDDEACYLANPVDCSMCEPALQACQDACPVPIPP
jgi:hypothetical protein